MLANRTRQEVFFGPDRANIWLRLEVEVLQSLFLWRRMVPGAKVQVQVCFFLPVSLQDEVSVVTELPVR